MTTKEAQPLLLRVPLKAGAGVVGFAGKVTKIALLGIGVVAAIVILDASLLDGNRPPH